PTTRVPQARSATSGALAMPSSGAQRSSSESAVSCESASQETAAPISREPPSPLRMASAGSTSTEGGAPPAVAQESAGTRGKASLEEKPTSNPDCPTVPAVSWKGGTNASPSVLAKRWKRACALASPGSAGSAGLPLQAVQPSGSG